MEGKQHRIYYHSQTPRAILDPGAASDFMRGDFVGGYDFLSTIGPVFFPSFDLVETKDHFTLLADLPGLSLVDLDIALGIDSITITGERESEKLKDTVSCHALERTFGSFLRTFNLPGATDSSKWMVLMNNGVLRVDAPKQSKEAAPSHHGPVQPGPLGLDPGSYLQAKSGH
jgi:HSP20 family protein